MVNNAGILAKGRRKEKPQQTAKMMETNFWGTLNMMKAFYPIINENGRIVNVSGFVSVKAMKKILDTVIVIVSVKRMRIGSRGNRIFRMDFVKSH